MATFPVDIVVSTPGAQQLAPLNRQLDQTDRSATGAATAVSALAAAAGAIGVGSAVKNAISVNRDFNKSISELSAITGATGRDLQFLTQASKEFGATTTLSASQAATAFKLIASAKPDLLSNAEALKVVTGEAIALAEAAGIDLPQAANALGNALNQFGADASEAGRFINVLAAGSKFGSSSIEETSEALKNAGVSAANAKLSFEATNAAIQALATSGLRGAEAGTGLRNVLTILDTSADKSLRPSIVGLAGALDELASRQLDNTEFVKLFGRENQNAARILLNQRENFKGLTTALTGTNVAYEQAATRVDNLNGDLLGLASAFEGVQIEAAQLADGGLRKVTQALTAGLQGLNENPERIAEALETLGVAATAVAAVFAGRFVASVSAAIQPTLALTTAVISGNATLLQSVQADKLRAAAAVESTTAILTKAKATQASAAAEVQAWRAVVQSTQAEINLESIRLRSQISDVGRQQSIQRLVIARRELAAATAGLTAAEAALTVSQATVTTATNSATAATARYTVAADAATISSRAVAVASTTASRAMAFLGGPVGVVLLAVTAFIAFSDSAEKASKAIGSPGLAGDIDELIAKFRELNDTGRSITLQKLNQEQAELSSALSKAREDYEASLKSIDALNVLGGGDAARQSSEQAQQRIKDLEQALNDLNARQVALFDSTLPQSWQQLSESSESAASGAVSMTESYSKLYEQLRLGIILTQQTERQAAVTTALSKLTADATDQERAATAALAAQLFDLNEARSNTEAIDQQRTAIDGNITALQQQLVALNLSGEQLAVYNATSRLGTEATDAQRASIEAITAAIYQRQEASRAEQALTQFDQSVESPIDRIEREADAVRQANLIAYEQGIQDLEAYKAREVAITQKAEADKTKAVEENSKGRIAAERQALSQALSLTSNVFGSIADTIADAKGKESKAYKIAFLASKAAAIAQAVIQTESAAIAALALPPIGLGPVAGVPYAGVIRGLGYASIGIMAGQAISGFKDGGYTGNMGINDVAGVVHGKEYVMTAQRTAQYRSELEQMRRGTFNANSSGSMSPRVTIINNVSDMATTTVTEGADGELIATIDRRIAEQTPGIVEHQLADPYSGSTRQLNSAYRLERR